MSTACASDQDYDPSIWKQLDEGASFVEEGSYLESRPQQRAISSKDVIIDPQPFFDMEMNAVRDNKTNQVKGSFPHPNITHLLISDNRELLEKKLAEAIPWGLM